jgi:hypothetical protein
VCVCTNNVHIYYHIVLAKLMLITVYACVLAAWKKSKAASFHYFIMSFNNIDSDSLTLSQSLVVNGIEQYQQAASDISVL